MRSTTVLLQYAASAATGESMPALAGGLGLLSVLGFVAGLTFGTPRAKNAPVRPPSAS